MPDDPFTSLATAPVTIGAIQGYTQNTDYTSSDLVSQYQAAVLGIQTTLHGTATPSNPAPTPPVISGTSGIPYAAQLSNLVGTLRDLLINGVTQHVDPNDPNSVLKTYYMTPDMAEQLRILFTALQYFGVNISPVAGTPVNISVTQAGELQQLDASSLILQTMFNFATSTPSNRSIQSLVELDYVKTANDMLSDQLNNLESALSTTKTTLDNLGNLQEALNQIQVNSKTPSFASGFNLNPATNAYSSPSAFASAYNAAASAYFSPPINPIGSLFPAGPDFELATAPSANIAAVIGDTANGTSPDARVVNQKLLDIKNDTQAINNATQTFENTFPGLLPPYIFLQRTSGTQFNAFDSSDNLIGSFTINVTNGNFNLQDQTVLVSRGLTLSASYKSRYDFNDNGGNGFNVNLTTPGNNPTTFSLSNYMMTSNVFGGPGGDLTRAYAQNNVNDQFNMTTLLPNFFNLSNSYLGLKNLDNPDVLNDMNYFNNRFTYLFNPDFNSLSATQKTAYLNSNSLSNFVDPTTGKSGMGFFKKIDNVTAGQQFWLGFVKNTFQFNYHSAGDFVGFQKRLLTIQATLTAQLHILSGTTPRINKTAQNPLGDEDPNSLLGRLRVVLKDLSDNLKTSNGQAITSGTSLADAYNGINNWLLDNYGLTNSPNSNKPGTNQQHLTFAITAGQSTNDTQKQQVTRFLYVFEEYYKSASAVLQQLTQILERIAQAIAR